MVKKPLIIIIIFYCSINLSAQDPVFTTHFNSLIYLNPSFAGSNEGARAQGLYRAQWWQLDGSYLNCYLSGDTYLQKIKAGIGASFLRDDQAQGTLVTNTAGFCYAQHLTINAEKKYKIITSVQGNYFIKTLDLTRLYFPNNYPSPWIVDPDQTKITKANLSVNAGLLFQSEKFYGGFSAFNINQPDEGVFGVSKLPLRFSAHASYNILLAESALLHLFANYQRQQSFDFYETSLSALLFKRVLAGAGFKAGNSPFVMLGFRGKKFCLIFNYERYFNSLNASSVGAFEMSLRFSFKKDKEEIIGAIEKW